MTALETRDKLLENANFQSDKKAATLEEQKEALKFYEELKSKSLAELSKKDDNGKSLLDDAEKHFMNLNRKGIEDDISSSLSKTRDISGSTKDALEQINRVLSLKANQDLRDGITKETLESAKNAETVRLHIHRARSLNMKIQPVYK